MRLSVGMGAEGFRGSVLATVHGVKDLQFFQYLGDSGVELRILPFEPVLEGVLDIDVGLDSGMLKVGTVDDAVAAPSRHTAG